MRTNTTMMVPEPFKVQLEQAPVADPGPRQILLRTRFSVPNLGTEMTIFAGDFPKGSWWHENIHYPHSAGWGCVGEVEAVGDQVSEFRPG